MRNLIRIILGVAVVGTPLIVSAQSSIILDNTDALIEGSWTTAASSPDRYDKDYKFSSTSERGQTASATYTPNIKTAGKYSIDIWYPKGDNRATNSPWVITYEGGKETVIVNQRVYGGQWVRIVTDKPFRVGTEGSAQVHNNTGVGGSVVVADGVRFVPEGSRDTAMAAVTSSGTRPNTSSSRPNSATTPANRNNFTLNITANNGSVMRVPDEISYAPGTEVRLTPRPDQGFIFAGWTGDTDITGTSFKNPLVIKMTSNKNITCQFVEGGLGVIMDNEDQGVRKEGSWATSSGQWAGKKYDTYLVSSAKASPSAKVTFTPNLPRAGKYDVYVWHPAGANRSAAAPWVVSSKSGLTPVMPVNQQAANGEWVAIASGVEMDGGSKPNQYAQVSNNTPDHNEGSKDGNRVVIADAVAFVYVGD